MAKKEGKGGGTKGVSWRGEKDEMCIAGETNQEETCIISGAWVGEAKKKSTCMEGVSERVKTDWKKKAAERRGEAKHKRVSDTAGTSLVSNSTALPPLSA